jgi:hypothetical protein
MPEKDPCKGLPLGQVLKYLELIGEGQIQEALMIQRKKGGLIGEILISLGYIAREELELALSAQKGMEIVDLEDLDGGDSQPGVRR